MKIYKHTDSKDLSNQGFPYCPHCGGVLYWDGENDLDEMVDIEPGEPNPIITHIHCSGCNEDFDVTSNNDGGYDFVDIENN